MAEPDDTGVPDTPRERARRQVCALFDDAVAEEGARGARDAALVSVLVGAGVESARAASLPLEAWDPDTGILRWRTGAEAPDDDGGTTAARRATEGARAALATWIEVRGDASGPLLLRVDADGEVGAEPLTPADVDRILAARARSAGVRAGPTEALRRLYDSPWWEDASPPAPSGEAGRGREEREPAVEGDP